jgi:hypothetical protein
MLPMHPELKAERFWTLGGRQASWRKRAMKTSSGT